MLNSYEKQQVIDGLEKVGTVITGLSKLLANHVAKEQSYTPPAAAATAQVSIRNGTVLHLQFGNSSSYKRGNTTVTAMAAKAIQQLISENGGSTNASFAGTGKRYLKVSYSSFNGRVEIPAIGFSAYVTAS